MLINKYYSEHIPANNIVKIGPVTKVPIPHLKSAGLKMEGRDFIPFTALISVIFNIYKITHIKNY